MTIMLIWSGTTFFVVWYVLAALTGGVGLAMRLGKWQLLPFAARVTIGTMALVTTVSVIALSTYVMYESASSSSKKAPDNLEWIIVLGAQVRADGSASKVLSYRLDAALDYLEAHPTCNVIVSGGQGFNEPISEADCMETYLLDHGIAQERIVRETASKNTVENIVFSARILNERGVDARTVPLGIVTNDFHIFRATAIARKQGLGGAVGISAYSVPWYLPNNLLRECLGIAKDVVTGNM
jgi:uncharacterized SAM-binding protein YcdF (DUF218 family)